MSYVVDGWASFELDAILRKESSQDVSGVIQAGHFFLEVADGHAVDHLSHPESAKSAFRDLVSFSQGTWNAACRSIVDHLEGDRPRLIILVNDWQYFAPKISERRKRESVAARLRREYYKRIATAPTFHLQTLATHQLSSQQVLPASQDCWMFSESELRLQFAARIRSLIKDEVAAKKLGLSWSFNENGQPIVSIESDGKECSLLYCGNSGCAGEVVELLNQLYTKGVRHFINVFPGECQIPVESGTEIARRIFGLDGMTVVNIAVRPVSVV